MEYSEIDWVNDPYPAYAKLRGIKSPLWIPNTESYHSEGIWLFSRYKDAQTILQLDQQVTKDIASRRFPGFDSFFDLNMLSRDGVDHLRLRNLVSSAFGSVGLKKLEVSIRLVVMSILENFIPSNEVDLIRDLAEPLPLTVICSIIGIPSPDIWKIRKWSMVMSDSSDSLQAREFLQSRTEVLSDFRAYMEWLIMHKLEEPTCDLVSELAIKQESGEISPEEALAMISFLLFAGHETTISLIGNMLWLLLSHPQQFEQLKADPSLVTSVVEESLRYESPTQRSTSRFALEDIEISGFEVKKGQQFAAILGSANRDEDYFENADKFLVSRRKNRHIAFGLGAHNCLGKNLARLEAKIVLEELLRSCVSISLIDSAPIWRKNSFFRGISSIRGQIHLAKTD